MKDDIMNMRFNLTPKAQDLILEMLINKQMLEEANLEADKVELMKKHQEELKKEFTKEFRINNIKEIKKFNKLLNK